MENKDLRHIASLARFNTPLDHLSEYFFRPTDWVPADCSLDELSGLFDTINTRIPQTDPAARLFRLYLSAGFLLHQHRAPAWLKQWMSRHVQPASLFANWKTLVLGRWQAVPILLTYRGIGYLRFLIIGSIPATPPGLLWPDWADDLMDSAAKQGIRHAAAASDLVHPIPKGQVLFAFPLMSPDARTRIRDGSLALPAGLGFLSALSRQCLPEGLAATGGIVSGGTVTRIGGLEKKIDLARNIYDGMIYPLANRYLSSEKTPLLLPVADLPQAWMFARLFSPETAESLVLFSQMLKNPDQFVRNIASMPAEWVDWAIKHHQTQPVMDQVLKTPSFFAELVNRFEDAVYRSRSDIVACLAALVDFKDLQNVSKAAPLLAFKWCSAGLSMCNHFGKVFESGAWISAADQLIPAVKQAGVEDVATYYNHYLVARHNRYDFGPEIPSRLATILSLLEKQYQLQCESGCTTLPVLGRIYGSMVQNHAFCGPRFLSETESFACLARSALGEGTVPEFEQEWRRQHNYLCCAFLDAGPKYHERARKTLFALLDVRRWDQVRRQLPLFSQWHHALMARFLADVPLEQHREMYVKWIASKDLRPEPFHPWQLWCFNMGRLAHVMGNPQQAMEWFTRSLQICMSDSLGPTIRVMGLLGLSGIWHLSKQIHPGPAEAYSVIRKTALELNPHHFAILEKNTDHEVLGSVWEDPSILFPFSYH